MHWDYKDQLRQTDLGGGGAAFYVYDASGQRVRKVWEKAPGLTEERIYLGGFEIFRKHGGPIGANTATLERETLHVMDDKQRIALVETRTLDTAGNDQAPRQLIRYQFGNHLGSASLELDEQAQIISYEEYAPYGSSTYQAVRSQTETPKRYRYTGKERDEESGLYYHGARYYASWLGRWISVEPALVNGEGGQRFDQSYQYAENRPIVASDPDGSVIWFAVIGIVAIATLTITSDANAPENESQARNARPSVSEGEFVTRTAVVGVSWFAGGGAGNAILRGSGSKILSGMGGGAVVGGIGAPGDLLASDIFRGEFSSASEYGRRTIFGVAGGATIGGTFGVGSRVLFGAAKPPPGGFGWRQVFTRGRSAHIGAGNQSRPGPSETNPNCRGNLCVADVGAHEANLVRASGTRPITNEEFVAAAGRPVGFRNPIENPAQTTEFLNQGFQGLYQSGRITARITAQPAMVQQVGVPPGNYLLSVEATGGGHALHASVSSQPAAQVFISGGRRVTREVAEELAEEGASFIPRTIYRASVFDPQHGTHAPEGLTPQFWVRLIREIL